MMMSRVAFLRRNPSFDERGAYSTPTTRSTSLSPIRMSPFYNPYTKPEYTMRGSYATRQLLDSHKYSIYDQPSVATRHKDITEWPTTWRQNIKSHPSPDGEQSSLRHRKSSANHSTATDLKRKMVFVLHDEMKLSPSVTLLEEISDTERITDICLTTLKSMMESKKYRKYLYHMNSNNSLFN